MLDDDERLAGIEQLAKGAHQLGDVVEVQAGGRLIEHEERALLRHRLAARRAAVRRLGQEASELQPLRLATAERGHRLAELHVLEPHVDDRLQHPQHLAVGGKALHRLAHGEFEHVGHRQLVRGLTRQRPVDGDFEQLASESPSIAVGAAQVHVTQELHLDVLEARAAAGRATAVAGVEAEHAWAVVALQRQRRRSEQLADLVERANVARRVRPCGLADGRLVDEHRVTQAVGTQQPVVRTGRFARLAELARQRRGEHVLDQGRLTRSRHARHGDQPLQRDLDRHTAQVVFAGALQDEPRRRVGHRPREAATDVLAPAEVGTGERVDAADRLGRAVEDDLPAALARARAHVDQPVRSEHHRRVVLDHHQRVAGIAQAVHRLDDAVHVARMQPDAGLVEHEHGVDQRGAERRGQVDALHFATRERAALPVEREVTQTDVAQVLQPGSDLAHQQVERIVEQRARQRQRSEEAADAIDGHQHQVVHREAGQRLELRARPVHTHRHEAALARQDVVERVGGRRQPPQQRLGHEPRAAASGAGCVAAVLRQEHADVHLVGLALEVLEEALDAVPLLVPVALPCRVAVDHEGAVRGVELRPRGVARNAVFGPIAQQVVLAVLPGGRLQRLDRAGAQRLAVVGDDQVVVDADDTTETAAGRAGTHRRVEAEHRRLRLGVAQVAVGAMQAGRVAPQHRLVGHAVGHGVCSGGTSVHFRRRSALRVGDHVDREPPVPALERDFDGLHRAGLVGAVQPEAVGHDIEHLHRGGAAVARGERALGLHAGVAARREPLLDIGSRCLLRKLDRESEHQPWVGLAAAFEQVGVDRFRRVVAYRLRGLTVEQLSRAGKQQLQVIVQLGHRADRAAAGAHRVGLVDGNRRRHAVDTIDRRAVHAVEELPRIRTEGLDVAALPFGIQRVENEARFARPARAGDHRHLAGANVEVEVLEVVLPGAADLDQARGRAGGDGGHTALSGCFCSEAGNSRSRSRSDPKAGIGRDDVPGGNRLLHSIACAPRRRVAQPPDPSGVSRGQPLTSSSAHGPSLPIQRCEPSAPGIARPGRRGRGRTPATAGVVGRSAAVGAPPAQRTLVANAGTAPEAVSPRRHGGR